MMIVLFALSFVLSLVMGWSLVEPFFRTASAGGDLKALEGDRERLFHSLEDLENDYRAGKLSVGDYSDIKERLVADLSAVMKQIER